MSGQIWSDADLKRIYAPEEIFSLPDAGNVLGFGQPFKWSSCHVSFKSMITLGQCLTESAREISVNTQWSDSLLHLINLRIALPAKKE